MDRDDALRRAEKLLRQGRLDAAIEEYAAVVQAYPKDWATSNLLGDLFIRAGRTDRAVAQYARIAQQLAADGFLSKASALYKKIIKISPDDEEALLQTAELSSQQGLLADARHVLHTLFQRRMRAGDRAGAAGLAKRLAALEPNDAIGRLDAARMLAELGDAAGAADQLRQAGDTLLEQGRDADALRAWRESMRLDPANTLAQERVTGALVRQGDLDGALASATSVAERRVVARAMIKAGRADAGIGVLEQVLEAEPGHVETRLHLASVLMARGRYQHARGLLALGQGSADTRVDLALAEADLRDGAPQAAAAILRRLLEQDPDSIDRVAALGASLAEDQPDVAFVALACAIDHLEARGDLDWALQIVERFVATAPRHIPALERFSALCRRGRYDDTLYLTESELVEAYLAHRRFGEALPLARRLAALRPDLDRHQAQIGEALAGLGGSTMAPSPKAAPGGPAGQRVDVEEFVASLGLPVHLDVEAETEDPAAAPGAGDAAADEPLIGDAIEIELAGALDALAVELAETPAAGAVRRETGGVQEADGEGNTLGDLFRRMRDESGRSHAEADAMRAYDEAGVHYNDGDFDQAVACLRRAARDPSLRFRASVMLARIASDRGATEEAIGWLERAAESPAPSTQAGRSVLYELGVALEKAGEPARALAVFLELNVADPAYRDVAARLDALAARRSGWPSQP